MIESVWIEIRPALRCCHVCVIFQKSISSAVQIKIKKSSILLEINNKIFNLNLPDFTVEPLTMTGFKSTKKCLNFRIQSECKFEFQPLQPFKSSAPSLSKEETILLCQCQNPLSEKVTFNRVLPLPSYQLCVLDMFCHLHGDNPPSNTIEPKVNDLFYSDDFIVISDKILKNCMKKEKFVKCRRCLSTIGIFDDSTVKFWISSLKLPSNNLSLLDHFKQIIRKAISDPFSIFPKILFECEENQSYLSVIVVDKNLIVSSCQENLQLKNLEVVKLKYKFHSSFDSDVKVLKDEPFHSLHHLQVHQSMLTYTFRLLISSSKTIPSIFSKVGDDCMAYLHLND